MSAGSPALGAGAGAAVLELGVDDPPLASATGAGVRVAVIDSGIHLEHPHVGGIADAIAIDDRGRVHDDVVDRLGHGTAICAAIHEKAPAATLHIIKVFHESLSTNVEALLLAMDQAVERGAHLVNLSLGTANPDNAPAFESVLRRLDSAGAILVAAARHGGRVWYPGSLPPAFGVVLDERCPRHALRLHLQGSTAACSGFARPIPGVPPERNINGVSLSVANATGILARVRSLDPDLRTAADARAAIRALARPHAGEGVG